MAKDYGSVGSGKYGALGKGTSSLKRASAVGRQDFKPEEAVDDTQRVQRGKLHDFLNLKLLPDAAKVLGETDEEFFQRREREKKEQAGKLAQDERERQERNLRESLTQQKARLTAEIEWDFYCCVVFQSAQQRRAFLEAVRWNWKERGGIFIDGQDLCKALNIPLPPGPEWKKGEPKEVWDDLAFDETFFDF